MQNDNKLRIAILGATLDAANMGVGALAAGAVRCLLHAYPDAEISILEYAKEQSVQTLKLGDREISIPFINMRFSKRFYLSNNIAMLLGIAILLKMIPSRRLRNWIISKNACFAQIAGMDLFVSIAGGDSFAGIYGLERLIYVSLPQVLALLLGKKLVLMPQTYGPFKGRLAKNVARYILRRADHIYSRDRRGLAEVKSLLAPVDPGARLAFCYDVGFVLQPIAPPKIDFAGISSLDQHTRPLIGLNVSGLLLMGGYTRNNMFGLRVDYRQFTVDLIHFLIEERGATVLLVPHVFGKTSESDSVACEQIFKSLKDKYPGQLGMVQGSYNQNEIKYIIGKCDFLLGARMHACIAAISQCIPAVCLAYSDKFIGVMETVGIESIVADARTFTNTELLNSIAKSYDDRFAIRSHLEQKMPVIRARVLELFGNAGRELDGESTYSAAQASQVIANR